MWRCSEGHEWGAILDNVYHGKTWCPLCRNQKSGRRLRCDNLTSAREIAERHGGRLLEEVNFAVRKKVQWECEKGHRWAAIFHNVRNGAWCPECAGCLPLSIEDAREIAVSRGGECLSSEYSSNRAPLHWVCGNGHDWMANLHSVKDAGSWCPRCPNKHESLCGEALKALFPGREFITTRAIPWLKLGKGGYPLELDFYCESLGLAVEYNGQQHYEFNTFFYANRASFERRLELDRLKAEACEENWVTLIVVPFTVADFRGTPKSKREAIVAFLREKLEELGYLHED